METWVLAVGIIVVMVMLASAYIFIGLRRSWETKEMLKVVLATLIWILAVLQGTCAYSMKMDHGVQGGLELFILWMVAAFLLVAGIFPFIGKRTV